MKTKERKSIFCAKIKRTKLPMIYRYASQDDIDDVVLPLDVDDVLSLSHDDAEEYPSC